VARRARVSIASVSRTLNSTGSVTPEIRERVLRAARTLRYSPHGAARSLITRRTHAVGLLLPDVHGEYFSELIRGVDRAARARGLHLLVSSSHDDAAEASAALRSMNGRVDGLLAMSPQIEAGFLEEAVPTGLPTVLMNTRQGGGNWPVYIIDDFGGARAMTDHLIASGRRRIAHIRGPDYNFEAGERLRGYQAALIAAHAQAGRLVHGDFTEAAGYLAGRALAQDPDRPDAVFAANDMMAVGCLFALSEAGIRVPQDIALGGFDDIPFARYVSPPLTTVRVDIATLGRRALERLAALIEEPQRGKAATETLSVELVVRASSGAPAPASDGEPGR
jgi:LacI family transcriptional regulator